MDMPTKDEAVKRDSVGGQTALLVIAWLWVGIPLLWGVYQTLMRSLPLFRL